jgi:hypothetical protein
MAFLLRQAFIAGLLGALFFCISCQERPLGQMPEVQREQPDPAKVWSDAKKKGDEEASPPPAEWAPHPAY